MLTGSGCGCGVKLDRVDELPGGVTLAMVLTFESSSAAKPVCGADALYRVLMASPG
jgi:hypothetical protein